MNDVKCTNLFLLRRTDKAILVEDKEGNDTWIPLSQISYMLKTKLTRITIEIPEWLAKTKNLDYE